MTTMNNGDPADPSVHEPLISLAEIRGAVARGWCHPANEHKEMDSTLALAIADEVHAALSAQPEQTAAARDVLAERRRQVEVEGWTPEHDDSHLPDEMALAACCYCAADEGDAPPAVWPWAVEWWKPKDRRRNMVKAAALLLAEIERLDRAAEKEQPQ